MPHDVGDGPWDDDLRDVRAVYLDAAGEFLVAEVDGEVVGIGAIRYDSDDCAEVKRIRVDPGFRRRGIADELIRALEERARALGYRRLVLDTAADALPAQRLFEKHGFRRTGKTVLGGIDALLYEKVLA